MINVNVENLKPTMPAIMELDNFYVIELPQYDDHTGEEGVYTDIVWYAEDTPPGAEWKGKKIKVCKFCRAPRVNTFSQMPGAKFYGPLELMSDGAAHTPDASKATSDFWRGVK